MITTIHAISAMPAPRVAPSEEASRCGYSFANGKRCRFPASPSHAGFCPRHFRFGLPQSPNDSNDLSADLFPELSESSSAVDIRQFLARLLVQLGKGRIGARRAAVLAFIGSQLLHSNRAQRNLTPRRKASSICQVLSETDR